MEANHSCSLDVTEITMRYPHRPPLVIPSWASRHLAEVAGLVNHWKREQGVKGTKKSMKSSERAISIVTSLVV